MSWAGITGKSANTDRSQQLQSYGQLNNLFNFGLNTGSSLVGAGSSATSGAQSYYQNILSGNRSQTNAAVAPGVNATLSQADATRKQQANMGTSRGGGVASTNEQAGSKSLADIQNQIFGARPAAAAGLNSTGGTELGAGTSLTGQAEGAASADLSDATQSREWTVGNNAKNPGLIANALSGMLNAAFSF